MKIFGRVMALGVAEQRTTRGSIGGPMDLVTRARKLMAGGRENIRRKIIPAIDVGSKGDQSGDRLQRVIPLAVGVVQALMNKVEVVKIGLQLHTAAGKTAIFIMKSLGFKIMLDLKLHDIPNTVEGAAFEAATCGVRFLTVHATGGPEMIRAARKGAEQGAKESGNERPLVIAVSILTSLPTELLQQMWPGFLGTTVDAVLHLCKMALDSGADGCVCSPQEVKALREMVGPDPVIIVPGTRLPDSKKGDQVRTGEPGEAMVNGATYLVVGRERDRLDEIIQNVLVTADRCVTKAEGA